MAFSKWYPAENCTSGPGAGAKALMAVILDEYGRAKNWGIYNCRTVRGGSTTSAHGEGRALDVAFPLSGGRGSSYGYELVNDILEAGPSKLGVMAIIYDRKIWSAKSPGGRRYTGSNPHYDHVHIELTRTAARNLSKTAARRLLGGSSSGGIDYGTYRKNVDPGDRTLKVGRAGDDVKHVQAFIGDKAGKADGYFGPQTRKGVRWYQDMRGIKVDGIVGNTTWRHILGRAKSEKRKPLEGKTVDYSNVRRAAQREGRDGGDYSVEAVQRALNYEFGGTDLKVDGIFGDKTRGRYAAWQRRLGYSGSDADGIPGQTSLKRLANEYGFRVKS